MIRLFSALAALGMLAIPLYPAHAAERADGVRNLDQFEFSSRHRGWRHHRVARMHYYDAYPWWWHPPYVHRARTYYLPWPSAPYDPTYDPPYPSGVVGYTVIGPWL